MLELFVFVRLIITRITTAVSEPPAFIRFDLRPISETAVTNLQSSIFNHKSSTQTGVTT